MDNLICLVTANVSKNKIIREFNQDLDEIDKNLCNQLPWSKGKRRLLHQLYTLCNSKKIPKVIKDRGLQIYLHHISPESWNSDEMLAKARCGELKITHSIFPPKPQAESEVLWLLKNMKASNE